MKIKEIVIEIFEIEGKGKRYHIKEIPPVLMTKEELQKVLMTI